MYADFSHDNDMMTIFAALGLYNSTELLLPIDRRLERDGALLAGYAAAYSVPFGARMFVEKMICGGKEGEGEREEYVRIIVNDRVMPLETCGGDEFGRCTLGNFVKSLSFAREGGKWDQCFGEDKVKIEADGSDATEDVKWDAKGKHKAKIDGER